MFYCVVGRAIHDVKATDMGLSKVRFKAEVDFDGRVVTRSYLEKQDIDQILNVSYLVLVLMFVLRMRAVCGLDVWPLLFLVVALITY